MAGSSDSSVGTYHCGGIWFSPGGRCRLDGDPGPYHAVAQRDSFSSLTWAGGSAVPVLCIGQL